MRPRLPEAVSLAEVRKLVDELFAMALTIGDQRSATGGQLEHLREGPTPLPKGYAGPNAQGDEHLWLRAQRAEERQHRYAMLILAWKRLTPTQQRVLMAQRTPCGSSTRVVEIRSGDLEEWTRRGAEVVGMTRKYDGKTIGAGEGRIFVSEPVPVYPKREQVAETLELTVDRVKRETTAAYDTLRDWIAGGEL